MSISYIAGFSVKPLEVSAIGLVNFTNGSMTTPVEGEVAELIPITPNQLQCEAYGYTYNQVDGTCSVFKYNTNINRTFSNIGNKTYGARNTTQTGTKNTLIMGENNTARSFTRNNIITGSHNEISNEVNNVNVLGTLGQATADNSLVIGGNAGADNLGERQSIQLMYGVQTTTSGTVDSYLNNVTGSYFKIPDNTVMYFNAEIVAVRVGHTGEAPTGNLGDYASFVERGVVINKSGTLSINRERDAIKSSGTVTLWRPTAAVDGTNFVIDIRGAANVTIEWAANITFTQIKTGVTL